MSNQQIIILEGADSTGKTEIGKALSEELGIPYFKNKYETERIFEDKNSDAATYCALYMSDFLRKTETSVILDRFHISEYVYSIAYNRQTRFEDLIEVENVLNNLDAKVIYCYKNDLDSYSDEFIEKEKVLEIKDWYDHYFNNNIKTDLLKLKTDDEDLDREINEVLEWLNQ